MAMRIAILPTRFLRRTIQPRRPRRSFALAGLLLVSSGFSAAQVTRPTDAEVKAAYLYSFGKFVTWPPDRAVAGNPFEICIVGKDPFGKVLDRTVAGERIGGRTIAIRRLPQVQQAGSCSILFVSSSEEGRLPTILDSAHRFHLLTVSDLKHFAERGGVIGLVVQQDRVRFEVNRAAAERCHIQLSSELLKVAVKVIDKEVADK
jgi:YfiR/HmsC-like